MSSTMRFHDTTPSLTPPPSDRGECDDTNMLTADAYLPEVFYPSPAPSFTTSQRAAFAPESPNMTQHESAAFHSEGEGHSMIFSDVSASVYPPVTAPHDVNLYGNAMAFPAYDQQSWVPYSSYPAPDAVYPYPSEDPAAMYNNGFMNQTANIIPPTPQNVAGPSFNFNDPLRAHDSTNFLTSVPSPRFRHRSSVAASITSASEVSSRSCSPSFTLPLTSDGSQSRSSASRSSTSLRPSLSTSRSSSSSLHAYGVPVRTPGSPTAQAWKCAYPNCTSRAMFTRGCDLRKHYNRHSKHLFCRVDGCPQSEAACIAAAQQTTHHGSAHNVNSAVSASDLSNLVVTGGFSSKKDRARHEAKHNPGIKCEWRGPNGEGCGRVFSRMDNMKDHVRRIHNKGQPNQYQSPSGHTSQQGKRATATKQ